MAVMLEQGRSTPPIMSLEAHKTLVTGVNTVLQARRMRNEGLTLLQQERIDALHRGLAEKRSALSSQDVQQTLTWIAERYKEADSKLPINATPLERFAARLAADFGNENNNDEPEEIIFSDWDSTATRTHSPRRTADTPPDRTERETIQPYAPGAQLVEDGIATEGRDALIPLFAQTVQLIMRKHPDYFFEGGKHAAAGLLRPGAESYYGKHVKRGIPVWFITANYGGHVAGAVSQTEFGGEPNVHFHGLTHNDVSSSEKETVLPLHIAENFQRKAIWIIDGESDAQAAIAAQDQLAGIFALLGSKADVMLTKEGIPHMTFNDFHEIDEKHDAALLLAREMKEMVAA